MTSTLSCMAARRLSNGGQRILRRSISLTLNSPQNATSGNETRRFSTFLWSRSHSLLFPEETATDSPHSTNEPVQSPLHSVREGERPTLPEVHPVDSPVHCEVEPAPSMGGQSPQMRGIEDLALLCRVSSPEMMRHLYQNPTLFNSMGNTTTNAPSPLEEAETKFWGLSCPVDMPSHRKDHDDDVFPSTETDSPHPVPSNSLHSPTTLTNRGHAFNQRSPLSNVSVMTIGAWGPHLETPDHLTIAGTHHTHTTRPCTTYVVKCGQAPRLQSNRSYHTEALPSPSRPPTPSPMRTKVPPAESDMEDFFQRKPASPTSVGGDETSRLPPEEMAAMTPVCRGLLALIEERWGGGSTGDGSGSLTATRLLPGGGVSVDVMVYLGGTRGSVPLTVSASADPGSSIHRLVVGSRLLNDYRCEAELGWNDVGSADASTQAHIAEVLDRLLQRLGGRAGPLGRMSLGAFRRA